MKPWSVRIFITPSGRTWRGERCRYHGEHCVYMQPLGFDTFRFGGVKGRHVERARIDRGDTTWRPQ